MFLRTGLEFPNIPTSFISVGTGAFYCQEWAETMRRKLKFEVPLDTDFHYRGVPQRRKPVHTTVILLTNSLADYIRSTGRCMYDMV